MKTPNQSVKLTKTVVESTPAPTKGTTFLRDTELKGFGLWITTKGVRTYFVASLWLQSSANIPDHIRGALSVRDFIMRDEARFRNIIPNPDAPRIRDLAGYRDRNRGLFLFTHDGFQEACGEANITDIARALASAGYLKTGERNRFTTKQAVDGHRPRLYAVYDKIIGYDPSGDALVVESGATGAEGKIEA